MGGGVKGEPLGPAHSSYGDSQHAMRRAGTALHLRATRCGLWSREYWARSAGPSWRVPGLVWWLYPCSSSVSPPTPNPTRPARTSKRRPLSPCSAQPCRSARQVLTVNKWPFRVVCVLRERQGRGEAVALIVITVTWGPYYQF